MKKNKSKFDIIDIIILIVLTAIFFCCNMAVSCQARYKTTHLIKD